MEVARGPFSQDLIPMILNMDMDGYGMMLSMTVVVIWNICRQVGETRLTGMKLHLIWTVIRVKRLSFDLLLGLILHTALRMILH